MPQSNGVIDVAIVGAGLAGATAALLLAKAGIRVAVVDPNRAYPAAFRCEKLSSDQLRLIDRLGLASAILARATRVDEVVIARAGRIVDVRKTREQCLRYDAMVNAVRQAWPDAIEFHEGRVDAITPSAGQQSITLTSGRRIEARLVVLATGSGERLRAGLGMKRRSIRQNQSICIGMDLITAAGTRICDRALTYYGERAGDGIAFATFFPFGGVTRGNFFCYVDPNTPLIREFRQRPLDSLFAAMPGLGAILGDVRVNGQPELRITDLYRVCDHRCDGVVLIGDAMHSSCPATGTGLSRVLTDAERLCRVHIPAWLATPGMDAQKLGTFYDDPEKLKVDRNAAAKAERDRLFATQTTWPWQARRWLALAKSRAHHALARRRFTPGAVRGPTAAPVSAAE